MHKRALAAALISASALLAGVLAAPSADAAPAAKPVPNTKPAWLGHAHHLGAASSSARVSARVYLAPRGGLAAVKAAATAVSTPGSPTYRKFLSSAQYQAKYGVTSAERTSVEKWLKASGLKVTGSAPYNQYLTVTGSAKQAKKAFGASIDRYQHDGQTVQAPATALKVPAAVATSVLTVTGLDTTVSKATTDRATDTPPPPAGFYNPRPCSLYYGQVTATVQSDFKTKLPAFQGSALPYAVCGYTGPQLRAAYEGTTDLDGTGATVGIVDAYAAPTIAADASTYAANHGDPAYATKQLTQVIDRPFVHTGDDPQTGCGENGWWGEETLDVEAVHNMAPGAKIVYYGAASCYDADFTDSLAKAVNQDRVQILSSSWGGVEEGEGVDTIAAYEQIFLQGALEGISFTFSSGDNGDEVATSGLKQADYPASDPYVTAVGGTSTAIDADGDLAWQTGWGTNKYTLSADGKSWTSAGYLYGAGGGYSALFNQPSYQSGIVDSPYRAIPDVAMDADPTTGMLVGQTQTFPSGVKYGEYRVGGTSLASPLFAGFTALAIGANGGQGFGLLNPLIYSNPSAFTDVKGQPKDAGNVRIDYVNSVDASAGLTYSVRTFNQDASLGSVTKGWDDITGLGSPTVQWLDALAD